MTKVYWTRILHISHEKSLSATFYYHTIRIFLTDYIINKQRTLNKQNSIPSILKQDIIMLIDIHIMYLIHVISRKRNVKTNN